MPFDFRASAATEEARAIRASDAGIRTADALLRDELDKAMRKFKRKNPDFAKACADARSIVSQRAPTPPPPPK